MKHPMKMQGFSIIELIVGLGVGLILAAGTVAIFAGLSRSSNDSMKITRLEYELRTALTLITHDIRRAGYSAVAAADIDTGNNTNAFMSATTDIQTPSSSCILFAYDINRDGVLPALGTTPNDKRFGYRLQNAVLQTRASADTTFSCTAGNWENLTNTTLLEVTALNFTLSTTTVSESGPGSASMAVRSAAVSITARLKDDTAVQRTLTEQVQLRNDKFIPPTI